MRAKHRKGAPGQPDVAGHRGSLSLSQLPPGRLAQVVGVPREAQLLRKLMAFGILPGSELMVLQRTPTIVVRLGFTDVALGAEIASLISVEPAGEGE